MRDYLSFEDIDSRETYLALSRRDTSEKSIESEV